MQWIVAILFGVGAFLIACDRFRVPFLKTSKALKDISKPKKTGALEIWMRDLAAWLSRFIKINEYKRMRLASDLRTANMDVTPELHIARAAVKAVPVGLLAIPALLIFPLIAPLVLATAVTFYVREVRSVFVKEKV